MNNIIGEDQSPEDTPQEQSSAELPIDPVKSTVKKGWHVFCPDLVVDYVTQISPSDLTMRGIKGLILDLDNTLVLWQKEQIHHDVLHWIETVKKEGIKLCILSNSILGKRSERIAALLGCSNVRKARKPSRSGFHRAMAFMGTTPSVTAIVGDQMFTDIWGGNRAGLFTIMAKPIHHKEFIYTRYISRPPERFLLGWFRRRGKL